MLVSYKIGTALVWSCSLKAVSSKMLSRKNMENGISFKQQILKRNRREEEGRVG